MLRGCIITYFCIRLSICFLIILRTFFLCSWLYSWRHLWIHGQWWMLGHQFQMKCRVHHGSVLWFLCLSVVHLWATPLLYSFFLLLNDVSISVCSNSNDFFKKQNIAIRFSTKGDWCRSDPVFLAPLRKGTWAPNFVNQGILSWSKL